MGHGSSACYTAAPKDGAVPLPSLVAAPYDALPPLWNETGALVDGD